MSLTKHPTHQVNPFRKSGIDTINVSTGLSENLVVDPESGEYFGLRKMKGGGVKRVDKRMFVKIYIDGTIDRLKDLSKPGLKIFCYLLKNIEPKKDFIFMSKKDVVAYCEFKEQSSYYDGLSELIDFKFIARSENKKKFYINSNLFFNGDRTQ